MTELIHQADIHTGTSDEFVVLVTARSDGKLSLIASPGMVHEVVGPAGGTLKVSLQLPYTTSPAPVRLTVTKE